jgi:hypothetical protein
VGLLLTTLFLNTPLQLLVIFLRSPIKSCLGDWTSPLDKLEDILENKFLTGPHLSEAELQTNQCKIFTSPPTRSKKKDLLLSSKSLAKAIKEGSEFGFVTIRGGSEACTIESIKQEARDQFGFCVQSYACNR